MPKPSAGVSVNAGLSPRPPRAFMPSGDLAGAPTLQTVVGIQGVPVSVSDPSVDQVLKFTGEQWAPQDESGGGIISVFSGSFTTSSNTYVRATSFIFNFEKFPDTIGPYTRQVTFKANVQGDGCGGNEMFIRLRNVTAAITAFETNVEVNDGDTVEVGDIVDIVVGDTYEIQIHDVVALSINAGTTQAWLEIQYV